MRVPWIVYWGIIIMPAPALAWAVKTYRDKRAEQLALLAPPPPPPKVGLLDLLSADKRTTIWYGYARDVPSVMERLSNPQTVSTLLVPSNSAILALSYKPHQQPPSASLKDADKAESLAAQELQSSDNVKRWIEGYVVPEDVVLSTYDALTHPTLLPNRTVTFTPPKTRDEALKGWRVASVQNAQDGGHVVQALEGTNGRVLLIDGCFEA